MSVLENILQIDPLNYKLKILKRIKVIRSEKGMTVPESRQGTRPTSQMSESTELKGTPQKSSLKIKTTKIENSLLDGAFDEEANANEFAAALKAWRKPETDDKENKDQTADNDEEGDKTDNNKKSVHFAAETKEKKSFLSGLGGAGAMWGVVEGVTVAEEGIGTDPLPLTEEQAKQN